ncbi:hypothetical protein ABVT39_021095 [Epinephelus coioides]
MEWVCGPAIRGFSELQGWRGWRQNEAAGVDTGCEWRPLHVEACGDEDNDEAEVEACPGTEARCAWKLGRSNGGLHVAIQEKLPELEDVMSEMIPLLLRNRTRLLQSTRDCRGKR